MATGEERGGLSGYDRAMPNALKHIPAGVLLLALGAAGGCRTGPRAPPKNPPGTTEVPPGGPGGSRSLIPGSTEGSARTQRFIRVDTLIAQWFEGRGPYFAE